MRVQRASRGAWMNAPGLMVSTAPALQRGRREQEFNLSALSHTLNVSSEAIPVFLGAPALESVRLSGVEGVNSLFGIRPANHILASSMKTW